MAEFEPPRRMGTLTNVVKAARLFRGRGRAEPEAGAAVPEDAVVFKGPGAGCHIKLAEDRAITLRQLGLLQRHICSECPRARWTGIDGELLEAWTVNLYHATERVIRPATEARRCSFVELLATGPQPPKWFVSHWWGEPVLIFIMCLIQHSHDRGCPSDASYWVCAYANNQWSLADDMGDTPEDSSFRRAMRIAEGTVCVLDAQAICYSRIWCIFEVFISIDKDADQRKQRPDYFFDIYTVREIDGKKKGQGRSRVAVGITDGYVPNDLAKGEKQCARRKRHRESRFPWELAHSALDIRVENARASQDSDRKQILRTISGIKDLDAPIPAVHPEYEELNQVLRGRFAAASWVPAAARGDISEAQCTALKASQLPSLALHFGGGCELTLNGDDAMAMLAPNLPPTLKTLTLGFNSFKHISDAALEHLRDGLAKLANTHCRLERLELSFEQCTALSDSSLAALAAVLESFPRLGHLKVNFAGCKTVSDSGATALLQRCEALLWLQSLQVDFSGTRASKATLLAFGDLAARIESEWV